MSYKPLSQHGAKIGRQYQAAGTMPVKAGKENDQAILARIITQYKDMNRKTIDRWRTALRFAKDPYFPRRYHLQDLYDDLETDGHYKSQVGLRNMATLSHQGEIIDETTGEVDNETTKLFRSSWFYAFCEMYLSFNAKGYTVMELIDPVSMRFEIIPRRNVIPEKKLVVLEVQDTEGIYYGEGFEDRIIEIGKPSWLGFINDIAPQLIWKRNAQQSWAEFSEKFGMPLITATSNKTNKQDLDKLDKILAALGEAARGVLPEGTTIDIKQFAGKDSYQVYDAQIERCNSEISKPIVGGTMTTDNGSSRSQSEVHERNLDDKIAESDRTNLLFVVNDKLIPMMRLWGWPVPENRRFTYPESFDMELTEHWAIVNEALAYYEIPSEWVSKTFNFPIDGIKTKIVPPADPKKPTGKGKKPAASFFD